MDSDIDIFYVDTYRTERWEPTPPEPYHGKQCFRSGSALYPDLEGVTKNLLKGNPMPKGRYLITKSSVEEPHHFDPATATGKKFDTAPASNLYIKPTFLFKKTKFKISATAIFSPDFLFRLV
jgi:hypothetical protein